MSKSLSITLTYGKDNLVTISDSAAGLPSAYKFEHSNRSGGPFVQVTTTFNVSDGKITFSLPASVVNAFGAQEYYQVTRDGVVNYTGSLYVNVPPASSAPNSTDLSNYYNKSEVDAKVATKTTDSTITTVGRAVLTSASASDARTAIGAGTSNLTVGTTSTTAKAGDYQPTIANVSGLQAALDAKGVGTVKTVNNTSPDGNGNVTLPAGASDISWYSERATSSCETVPYGFQLAGGTITNGSIFAGLTTNKTTKTYTGARFHLISQTTAPTDLFLGVWSTDGTLLAATGNLTLTVGALNGGTFTTPLTLTAGQQVYVGISCIGGSAVSIARYNYAGNVTGTSTAMATLYPTRIEWYVTGNAATSAAPPALTGTTTNALIPWISLY